MMIPTTPTELRHPAVDPLLSRDTEIDRDLSRGAYNATALFKLAWRLFPKAIAVTGSQTDGAIDGMRPRVKTYATFTWPSTDALLGLKLS